MNAATIDFQDGIKSSVAEIKFLIHDLRVEPFINEVIHFHVTLNTDLELHGVDQVQALHGADLATLKDLALTLRKSHREYSNAVRNFSPDETIVRTGRKYIDTVFAICELILNPLWGRSDQVLVFLPSNSRSVQGRSHYRNCIAWIRGVRARITNFLAEHDDNKDLRQQFDIAGEIEAFTRDVIRGYVAESGRRKVELQVGPLEPAVVFGNLPRFRRMFFNLVMNAVDAMSEKRVGVVKISSVVEGEHAVLRVQDDGAGMTPEKVAHLMRETVNLDGELHSLGFVFVRRTVAQFSGELSIDSRFGEGTTVTVRIPRQLSVVVPPRGRGPLVAPEISAKLARVDANGFAPVAMAEPPRDPPVAAAPAGARERPFGEILLEDFKKSEAQHPGCVFVIAVSADGRVDGFAHRPYEKLWDTAHEDLAPMLYQAISRGRIEQDEVKEPMLILKPPQDAGEYFEFREVPEDERSAPRYLQMVRDEYIRIARKLIATGLPPEMNVVLADGPRFFGADPALSGGAPTTLRFLSELAPSTPAARADIN